MNLYSRARKHIDMDRVKELREERIKREQIAEILQQQDKISAELKEIEIEETKYCDWKKELEEGMTTAGLGMINLDAAGDVDLVDLGNETPNPNVNPDATNVGGTYTFGPVTPGYGFASTIAFSPLYFDLSQVDTVVFNFTAGDITSFAFTVNNSSYNLSTSSGLKVITLRQSDRVKNALIAWTLNKNQGDPVGTNRISGVALQRRRPMNVLVSLDDPQASAFIRDGDFDRLSNEEKKKKLEEMLSSSEEYLNKMFGEGMPKGATTIADTEPQQSFVDNYHADKYGLPADYQDKLDKAQAYFQNNLNKLGYRTLGFTEPERMDALYDIAFKKQGFTDKQIETIKKEKLLVTKYGESPSLKAAEERAKREAEKADAERQQQARSSDLRSISNKMGGSYSGTTGNKSTQKPYMNIRVGDKPTSRSTYNPGKDYGQVAAAQQGPIPPGPRGYKKPGTYNPDKFYQYRPEKPASPNLPFTGPGYSKKIKRQRTMVAHHEPQGEVIKEKKSFKDITKKIPGYYDGKPSPLGFPVEEPPKMKNGFHPDLVDGKKVANRFNRLDPQSAKAMPKTGNPHIDKKVRAAAKKTK